MNTRLKQFIAAENITQSQFAEKIQVVRASVSHVLSGRNNPGYDFIKAIMLAYPSLNIEWLMLGKGKMYKDTKSEQQTNTLPEPIHEGSLFYDEEQDLYEDTAEQNIFTSAQNFYTEPQKEANNAALKQTFTTGNTQQVTIRQRKATKVIVFFDDGTYQEM